MDYKQINDYEVMYMVRENDEDARGILFKKYLPIVGKIASKYTGFTNRKGVDFDDLLQEGLIALNAAINGYEDGNGVLFYTYVSVCIERHLSTYCRRLDNKKNYFLNNSIDDDNYYFIMDSKSSIDYIFNESLAEEEFIRCKNAFDIKHSSIFELRYNGFSYKEISRLLDISISTVDGRLYRIRKSLQEKYNFKC